jgi:lipoprotein signal peptidase
MLERGYTAALALGKSRPMSRMFVLVIAIVVIVGGLYFLSTLPKEQPTQQIEVAVPQGGNAQ